MATTLEDIQLELEIANQEDDKFRSVLKQESTFNQEMQLEHLSVLQGILGVLNDSFEFDKLLALKKSREIEGSDQKEEDTGPPVSAPGRDDLASVGTVGEMLAAIAGAVAGLASGIVAGLASFTKSIAKKLIPAKTQVKIRKMWRSITGKITKFFNSIGKTIDKVIKAIQKPFKALSKSVSNSKMGKLFKSFSKLIGRLTAPIKASIQTVTGVVKEAGYLGKIFKSFAKFFQPLGKIIGKYIAPIIIAIDYVKELFKIWGDDTASLTDKLVDTLFAIPKVIGNFFIEIPEMIKNAFSWLIKKLFGNDNAVSKFLDGFSFTEMWSNAIDAISNFFKSPVESFKNMIKGADEAIHSAIEWVKKVDFWDLMNKGIEKITEIATNISDSIGKAVKAAIDWIISIDLIGLAIAGFEKMMDIGTKISDMVGKAFKAAIDWIAGIDLITPITKFFSKLWDDPEGGIMNLIKAPINLIKDGIAWVLSKIGFELVAGDLKEWDAAQTFLDIVMAPVNLIKSGIAWVMGKLGFDDLAEDLKSWDPLTSVLNIITAPIKLLGKAVDFILDKLGFDSLSELIPDVTGPLKAMADWLTGMIDAGIQWIKDKLSFFGGSDEDKAEKERIKAEKEAEKQRIKEEKEEEKRSKKEQKEMQKLIESKGIVKKEGGFAGFGGTMTIDDETLRALTDAELEKVWQAYHDNPDLAPKLEKEGWRRKEEYRKMEAEQTNKDPGTLQTALQPQSVVEVDEQYTPSAIISGTQQQAVAQSNEMRAGQAVYDENKGPVRQGGDVNTSVNAPTTNNQTINNTYTQSNQPSTRDDTDQMYIFRATGTSR